MMARFAELLGNAIFAAFLKWADVKDLEELLGKGAAAVKSELEGDLAKIDAMPGQIVGQVIPSLRNLLNQAMSRMPFPFSQFQI